MPIRDGGKEDKKEGAWEERKGKKYLEMIETVCEDLGPL